MAVYSTYTDQELVALLKEGDQRVLSLFFEQRQQLMYSIAYKLTRSKHQAKEVVQDVFLKLWVMRRELTEVENLGAYLNRLARNQSIDYLRKIAREAIRNVELKEEQLELSHNATEEQLEMNETTGMIRQALETLSPQGVNRYATCPGRRYASAILQYVCSDNQGKNSLL